MTNTMTNTYKITWSHTSAVETFDTYEEAVAAVEAVLSEPEIGHDGDISEGGERTLFWASSELATNDDGSRAAGSIGVSHAID
jgi:hypothetical protein